MFTQVASGLVRTRMTHRQFQRQLNQRTVIARSVKRESTVFTKVRWSNHSKTTEPIYLIHCPILLLSTIKIQDAIGITTQFYLGLRTIAYYFYCIQISHMISISNKIYFNLFKNGNSFGGIARGK